MENAWRLWSGGDSAAGLVVGAGLQEPYQETCSSGCTEPAERCAGGNVLWKWGTGRGGSFACTLLLAVLLHLHLKLTEVGRWVLNPKGQRFYFIFCSFPLLACDSKLDKLLANLKSLPRICQIPELSLPRSQSSWWLVSTCCWTPVTVPSVVKLLEGRFQPLLYKHLKRKLCIVFFLFSCPQADVGDDLGTDRKLVAGFCFIILRLALPIWHLSYLWFHWNEHRPFCFGLSKPWVGSSVYMLVIMRIITCDCNYSCV